MESCSLSEEPLLAKDLGIDVLELVAALLSLKDRTCMAGVCKKWRNALLNSEVVWNTDLKAIVDDPQRENSFNLWLSHRPHAAPRSLILSQEWRTMQLRLLPLQILLDWKQNFTNLKELTLWGHQSGCFYNDLLHHHNIPRLESLHVHAGTNGDLQFMQNFSHMSTLQTLIITARTVCFHAGWAPLKLQFLKLSNCHLASAMQLCCPKTLTGLELHNVTSAVRTIDLYNPIWDLHSLQHLTIERGLENVWPRDISRLTALTHLNMYLTDLGGAENADVSSLRNLQYLNLSGCRLRDLPRGTLGLEHLRHLILQNQSRSFRIYDPKIWKIEQLETSIFEMSPVLAIVPTEPVLANLQKITFSELSCGMSFGGDMAWCAKNLMKALKLMPKLEVVEFKHGALKDCSPEVIGAALIDFVKARTDVEVIIREIE